MNLHSSSSSSLRAKALPHSYVIGSGYPGSIEELSGLSCAGGAAQVDDLLQFLDDNHAAFFLTRYGVPYP